MSLTTRDPPLTTGGLSPADAAAIAAATTHNSGFPGEVDYVVAGVRFEGPVLGGSAVVTPAAHTHTVGASGVTAVGSGIVPATFTSIGSTAVGGNTQAADQATVVGFGASAGIRGLALGAGAVAGLDQLAIMGSYLVGSNVAGAKHLRPTAASGPDAVALGSLATPWSVVWATTARADTLAPVAAASLTIASDVIPDATGARVLGSAARVYSDAYITNVRTSVLTGPGTITVVGSELSPDAPNLRQLGNGVFYWQSMWGGLARFNTLASIAGTGIVASETMRPSATGTLDLGTSGARWRDAYLDRAHVISRCGEMGRFLVTGVGVAVVGLVRVQITGATFQALADFQTSPTVSLDGRILGGITVNRLWFQNQSASPMYVRATIYADYTPGSSGTDAWYLTVASTENAAYNGSDENLLAYAQQGTTNNLSRMLLTGVIYWPAGWYVQLWVDPVSITNTGTHQYAPNLWAHFSIA